MVALSALVLLNGCFANEYSTTGYNGDVNNVDNSNNDNSNNDNSNNDNSNDDSNNDDNSDDNSNSGFESVWRVGNSNYGDGDYTVTLPLKESDEDGNNFEYDFTIDWGDSSQLQEVNAYSNDITHTYGSAGDKIIKITGSKFPALDFESYNDKNKLIEVKNLGVVGWKSFHNAFYQCQKLSRFTVGNTDTSQVTNMNSMFFFSVMTSLDLSSFDTSQVKNMDSMFYGAQKLASADLSDWNVTSLTSATYMFTNTPKLIELNVRWGSFTGIGDQRAFLGSPVNSSLVINCSTSGADFFEKTCN